MNKIKHILISTPLYPPQIGGPSQYAKNLADKLIEKGNTVSVSHFGVFLKYPTVIRHIAYFFSVCRMVWVADFVIILDTFSVGFPTVLACKLFNKKCVIRTGGDFLWEFYVERTKRKILFRNFYITEKSNFSFKEKIVFFLSSWTMRHSDIMIFSTDWQRKIFISAYSLREDKTAIIENYYGPKESDLDSNMELKTFIATTRDLVWKNIDTIKHVWNKKDSRIPHGIDLLTVSSEYHQFMDEMKRSYAVILVSLGDISPNMILDAIRYNRPFICTREVGIYDRIKDAGIFVDPLDEKQIEDAVLQLMSIEGYKNAKEKVRSFHFTHTWDEIAGEFITQLHTL